MKDKRFNIKKYKMNLKKCKNCGSSKNLTKHHKKKKAKGGRNYQDNIQILCRDCHDRKHNMCSNPKKKGWTDKEISKLMRRYKQGHSYSEISKELERTRSACYTMVHNVFTFNDVISRKIRKLSQEIPNFK